MSDASREAAARAAIGRLLRPRSVAVIGASNAPGSLGGGVMGNLARFAFAGDVHLVNPSRREIDGRPCLAAAADLPRGVDCAVLAIPGKAVLETARACAARGVGAMIVYAAGFAEAGEQGRAAQDELARIAGDAGMALAGPNCLGMINYLDGVCLTFGVSEPRPVTGPGLAIVSQSGAMATVARAALHARGIGVTFSVSTGNEALNGIEDFLGYVLDDEKTAVISLVVEQMREPKRFLELARRARAMGKPLVLLHPGRSAAARESAQTHTGALAGDWEVMRAAATYAGACVVETLEELIDVSEMLLRCPPMGKGGIAVITDSGAFKGMTLDYCADIGLPLPQPSPAAAALLGAIAPNLVLPTNPLDLTAQALVDPELYRKTLEPMLADDRYAAVVFGVIFSNPKMAHRKNAPILQAMRDFKPTKPVILAMLGDEAEVPQDLIAEFRALGVPFIRSPERAMRALARLREHANGWQPALDSAPREIAPRLRKGVLCEYEAKGVLALAGVPVAPGEMVTSLEAAGAAARRIGYPVALKAQSAQLTHKTEAGGVILGLADEEHLAQGWTQLHANLSRSRPDLDIDGVLIEAMAPRGAELIIGARNDPEWGAMLLIGLGGVFAEALRDMRVMPAGLGETDIVREISQLKGAAVLNGFRGAPPCDIEAAAAVAAALGAFVLAHPEVTEADLNPVTVYPHGQGALALDALVIVE